MKHTEQIKYSEKERKQIALEIYDLTGVQVGDDIMIYKNITIAIDLEFTYELCLHLISDAYLNTIKNIKKENFERFLLFFNSTYENLENLKSELIKSKIKTIDAFKRIHILNYMMCRLIGIPYKMSIEKYMNMSVIVPIKGVEK